MPLSFWATFLLSYTIHVFLVLQESLDKSSIVAPKLKKTIIYLLVPKFIKMAKVRVTKEFRFEAAHALYKYDGLCKNIHGHSYILRVTIIGTPIQDRNNPKRGMVIDFGDLKRIVNKEIVNRLDHSVMLNQEAPHQLFTNVEEMFDRIHILDYQPTCENMVVDFANIIKSQLPKSIELFSIQLYETATSYAEWYASDNK